MPESLLFAEDGIQLREIVRECGQEVREIQMKKLLLVRSFASVMNIKSYNSQEIGLCKAFCRHGYDCDIVYFSTENRSEEVFNDGRNKVTLLWRKGFKLGTMAVYPKYLNPFRLMGYDIVISNGYDQIMSICLGMLHKNVYIYHGPYFNTFESDKLMRYYDALCVPLCNRLVKGVFVKTADAGRFLKEKGIKETFTVGVGLDIERFENLEARDNADNCGREDEIHNIVYVGTDEPRKRVRYIIKVFAALCAERDDVRLIIVGEVSRERKRQLLGLLKAGHRERVVFMGKMDNTALAGIYRDAACLILASNKEIFGMTVLESMYFGTPCVANSVAGPRTIIDDRVNGILEDGYDIESWKEDIVYLLDNGTERKRMGEAARRKVLQDFTWERVAHKMMGKTK